MPRPTRKRRSLTLATTSLFGFVAVAGLAGLVVAGMTLPFLGPVSLTARDSVESFEDLPAEFREPALPVRTVVYAADGKKIATIYDENRVEVPLDDVSEVMQQAVVAIEDSRFFEHNGVDLRGMTRAALTNLGAGEISQGGSTLTMQYVKNVLVTAAVDKEQQAAAREDTITRKLREMRYALALEKRLTKQEILQRYLNISYYGSRAYGVEAASQRYFSKHASELTLVEAATLAGIVQQPTRFDPLLNPKLSQARRDVVLNRMAELNYITVDQARAAKAKKVKSYLKPQTLYNGCTTAYAPYFCDYAVRQVKALNALGNTPEQRAAAWKAGGYKIYTTLNMKAQRAATNAVMKTIPPKDPSQKAVAIAMIEPGTGNIQAMAQNTTWGTDENTPGKTAYNLAVNRPDGGGQGAAAGSTFKVFTLVAALEKGVSPYATLNSPNGKAFTGFTGCSGALLTGPKSGGTQPFVVRNSTRSGTFNMFQGAAYSVNTFFVGLEKEAGLCETVDAARRMGVTHATGEDLGDTLPSGASAEVASFTLGSTEVSPLTMANAYATISAHGVYCKPRVITKITDRDGKSIPVPASKCEQVITRNVADATAAILTNVVDGSIPGRTGAQMTLGRDTTGKTGTINNHAAVWFAGATPDMSAAVMVYDPRGAYRHPLTNLTINGRYYREVFGLSIPGPVWKASMLGALKDSPAVAMDLRNEWNLKAARQGGSIRPPAYRYSPPTTQGQGAADAGTSVGTGAGQGAAGTGAATQPGTQP